LHHDWWGMLLLILGLVLGRCFVRLVFSGIPDSKQEQGRSC
jgi:hypothetical protein